MNVNGISIRHTNISIIPSVQPAYVKDTGRTSYPSDRKQESSLPAHTPLKIIHKTKDGAWFYVQMPYLDGWVCSSDIVCLTKKQTHDYMNHSTYITIIDANIPTFFMNNQFNNTTG